MSRPFYNPYASGNQSSTQGSYGLSSTQGERNPRTASPHFGPGSSSSAASSATPGRMIPSLLTQSVSYRPEQGRAKIDKDIERSVDLHISRAREEVTFVGKPDHWPIGQSTCFTNTQEVLSSGKGTTSYLMSTTSASARRRHCDVESGSGSSDWLPCFKRPTADDSSKFYSSPASTNFTSSERERDVQPTPGLGDYDYRVSDKPVAPTETSHPKYNSESAANILLQFGLEKKDLDYLIAYPEDQMTPDNLPFILRQIRIQKTERASTAIEPKPCPQPQPIRGVSGVDGFRSSGGSSAVSQPTKVIDYGHTGNYTGGVLDEIESTSGRSADSDGTGNMLLVKTNNISSHIQELLQKDLAGVKSSALGSSFGQGSTVTNSSYNSILRSVAPPCIDPAKQLKTQPHQTSQAILSSSSLSRKDKDGGFRHEESAKACLLKKTEADHKSASKTQLSSSLFRGVHPNRPGLVLIGTSEATGTTNPSTTQGKGSMVTKQIKKQQQPTQKQQMPKKQVTKQPVTQMGKALWPPVDSATQPPYLLSVTPNPSRTVQPSVFSPHPISIPSASLQPARSAKNFLQLPTQHPAKLPGTKNLPSPAMMHDYAAATPRVFPHTCSLCFKEFTNMKDWISHQNTSLHLESCRVLRTKYPQWNGEIVLEPSATRKDAKPSSSAYAQTSQQRHGGRSHSEGRREKHSRSLSSHSSRYTRSRTRSRSPRYDRDWSRSRSNERKRRRDDRWSSPRRSRERRSSLPRRSEERWSSPRRSRERRSSLPRRSEERWSSPRRSRERLSSPRRRGDRWSSPRWSEERWSSPRRSRERLASPRRGDERWLSPKRRDDMWYSQRPLSSESSPQRRLSSANRLSKKQTGKSDVQSLSELVKTLTPSLLNKLAKETQGGKRLNLNPSAAKKSLSSAAFSSAKKTIVKTSTTTSLQKLDVYKPSPPTMVRLEGIVNTLSHSEVVAAVEQFGKTKSVVLFRKKREAMVCFEKEEDAKKLKSLKSINMKGTPVSVVTQTNLQLKNMPLKKPVLSCSVSTSQTTKSTKTTTSSRTVLLPKSCKTSQNSSGAKKQKIQQAPASASKDASRDPAVSHQLLTIGDMIIKHIHHNKIKCFRKKICQLNPFLSNGNRHMMITNLPRYEDGLYTEEDIANIFIPYGFNYTNQNIYVFPEAGMAFLVMSTLQDVQNIMKLNVKDSIMFKGSRLLPHVMQHNILKSPLVFYKSLMNLFLIQSKEDRTERIIYIENISPSQARDLRETLRKIDSVTNYLPLLNKVFVEFDSSRDADRIGVWYSLLKHAPGCNFYRLKTPFSNVTALAPKHPVNAMPDSRDVVPGATIPSRKTGIPQGSIGAFWIMMSAAPFVFPTVSPWFIIPRYLTIKGNDDIKKANSRGSMFPTIMLTGLPEGEYKHEDVAKLVWPYFSKQTLHSLYYNVIVLTLQRRAFVHFSDWTSCCNFVQDHIRNPRSVRGCTLKIHFVLEYMYPESKEELMYKSLMKWSNAHVPDAESLEERLLCVEISETSVDVVKSVMKAVASVAKFVSFLPLANRICVEMVDSSGVAQVVEKYRSSSLQLSLSNKVQSVEFLKNQKQRLEDSSEIIINLELSPEVQPPTQSPPSERSGNDPQLVLQTSDSASAKPAATNEPVTDEDVAAEPSSTAAGDVAVEEDDEEVGTETVLDTVGPQTNEDAEKEEVSTTTIDAPADGNCVPADSNTSASVETSTDLPRITQDVFRAIKAAVHRHRLTQEMKKQSEENESSSNSNISSLSVKDEATHQEKGQDDLHTSGSFTFDEPNFNMGDFVTVDEIADDGEEISPDPHSSSSSKQSSTAIQETQSSDTSSAPKQTSTRSSTRSLKDSKSSASSSSKSTKDFVKRSSSAMSTSVSPKTMDSSKPSKSPASSSSSFLSLETSPSACHKAQQSKTKSSSCEIQPSSTASEVVNMLSAAVSVERLPVSQREAAKESAVAKSDHNVSAEGIAAKTVESETKIEKSPEMHPPAQGQRSGLSQDQNLETDLKDTSLKDPEKDKEKKKEEEEEDDCENYEILDSFDHQTNEYIDDWDQVGSSDSKPPEPENEQSLQEENFQVLDCVNDDDGACSERSCEKELDTSFQVVDSGTEDRRAALEEESYLVADDRSTAKQLSQEGIQVGNTSDDKPAIEDSTIKHNEDSVQALDTGIKQAARGKEDAKRTQNKEGEVLAVMTSAESCKPSKPDAQIPKDEDQPLKVCDNKDSEVTEETFEILDSTDDQTAMDHDGQNTEALSDQMSKEEEEDANKVVDSVEDQPTTTQSDNKEKKTAKPDATSRRDDRSSKRSGLRTRESKSEEKVKSPEKQDRMVKKSETPRDTTAKRPKKDQDAEEEKVYEIVDSIEEELVQDAAATERTDRRRSGRGKKEEKMTLNLTEASEKEDEEASYEILDSVEDETATEEPVVMRRSTRGRRERTTKKDQAKKEDTPTRRRRTPARESQEKTPKKEEKASSKESSPTKKSDIPVREEIDEDVTYEILDSVEDEALKDDPPTTGGKGKRGRPKKAVKSTRKDIVTLKGDKDASEKEADEEKVSYQILDAVEDEMVDDGPPPEELKSGRKKKTSKNDEKQREASLRGLSKNKEEEPLYQIVDSVEDDQVQEELTTEVSEGGTKETSKTKDETRPKEEEAAVTETPTFRIIVEASEKVVTKDLDHDASAGLEKRKRSSTASIKKERASTTKSQSDPTTPEVEKNQKPSGESDTTALMSALVNLDEVSDEEEDYPDNIAQEEEVRGRKTAAKEKELTRERRSRCSSGEDRRKTMERGREKEEEVDTKELVTLDEVGADEAGEEMALQGRGSDVEITAEEMQGLVTLDEIVEEDEEEGKGGQRVLEPRSEESLDSLNPENLLTLDEAGEDEEERVDEAEKTSTSAKRKFDDDTEENVNFVTVDEVGEVEEEEEENKARRTRGRAKKRTRKTPVRKSTRGRKHGAEDEREKQESGSEAPPPTSLDASEVEGANLLDIAAVSSVQDLQPESLEGEEETDGGSSADVKVVSKRKNEIVEPEAKRSRSQSPSVPADFKLPPFRANNPLGQEFVVPKSGYFCNICRVFYLNESSAKDVHCSSQTHYNNLRKHYQKLQQKLSGSSTPNSQYYVSD